MTLAAVPRRPSAGDARDGESRQQTARRKVRESAEARRRMLPTREQTRERWMRVAQSRRMIEHCRTRCRRKATDLPAPRGFGGQEGRPSERAPKRAPSAEEGLRDDKGDGLMKTAAVLEWKASLPLARTR